MPSTIIGKVNKVGVEDGNKTLKFFDRLKAEFDFFEDEEEQQQKENDEGFDISPMNLPGIEEAEDDEVDQ